MNIDFVFHFDQRKFIRSKILDVSLHQGICLSMCIDFIDRRKKKLPCDFIYFSKLYQFSSLQRALSYGTEAGKIQDAVLFPNGRFKIEGRQNAYLFWGQGNPKYEFLPATLPHGDYIINIVFYNYSCHVIALRNNLFNIEVFDPNSGLFVLDNISDLKTYLTTKYRGICNYIYTYHCK